MDPETKKLLEENVRLTRETNKLVHKMWSSQRWGRMFRIFYWLLILGASFGVYYYLQPYLQIALGNYEAITGGLDKIQETTSSLPDASSLNSILDQFR